MALGSRAQFYEVHGLAGVHLHGVADSKRERHHVLALLGELVSHLVKEGRRTLERLLVPVGEARLADNLRHIESEFDVERLPFDGHEAMTLEVAKRAVVSDELEAVVRALECASGPVSTIPPFAHVRPHQRRAVGCAESPHVTHRLVVGHR